MDKKFGTYIFGGLLLGVLFGLLWTRNGNSILGISIGAFIGTFIGWFVAAYAMENEKNKKQAK